MSLLKSKKYTVQGLANDSKGKILFNLLFTVGYLLISFSRLQQMKGVPLLFVQVPIAIFCIIALSRYCKNDIVFRKFIKFLPLLLAAFAVNIFIVGNSNYKHILYAIVVTPSIALTLYYFNIKRITAYVIFFLPALYTLYYLLRGGSPDEFLFKSHNYISYYTVLNSLPYFIMCGKEGKTPSLLIPFMCLVIAVLSIGRGGIIMSVILTFGIVILNWNRKGVIGLMYKGLFAAIIGFLIYYGVSPDFVDMYLGRFVEYGIETTGREEGWSEYFNALLNPINLLLGVPVSNLNFVWKYLEGSLHNSFLTLHARYGIIALYIIFAMFKGLWYSYKIRIIPIVMVFLALLFKAFTDADTAGEATCGDIYVYFLFLLYLESAVLHRRKSDNFS